MSLCRRDHQCGSPIHHQWKPLRQQQPPPPPGVALHGSSKAGALVRLLHRRGKRCQGQARVGVDPRACAFLRRDAPFHFLVQTASDAPAVDRGQEAEAAGNFSWATRRHLRCALPRRRQQSGGSFADAARCESCDSLRTSCAKHHLPRDSSPLEVARSASHTWQCICSTLLRTVRVRSHCHQVVRRVRQADTLAAAQVSDVSACHLGAGPSACLTSRAITSTTR